MAGMSSTDHRGVVPKPRKWMLSGPFGGGVVDGLLWRAGKLELPAGLQRDAAGDLLVAQADGIFAVVERMPAGARFDAGDQCADAVVSLIGHRPDRVPAKDMLLVFGADPPLGPGLRPARHRLDEVGA
jgi:hypothetical protein